MIFTQGTSPTRWRFGQRGLLGTIVGLLIQCVWINPLHAVDLMDVYYQALDSDPQFKQAYSQFLAQNEALPQAWAHLLPQLTLSALAGRYGQRVDTGIFKVAASYNGTTLQAVATQNIFNYQAWSQVQLAKASVRAALATFNNEAQQLMLRTTSAYLTLLLAQDTLHFAQAKKAANLKQLEQAQARFKVGLDAITAVYEAQAAYDQSTADVIASNNKVLNEAQNLSKITNHLYDHIATLRRHEIPLIAPEPNRIDDWVSTGLKQNFNLFVAKYNLESARENIKVQTAGNWPVFSIKGGSIDTRYNDVPAQSNITGNFASQLFIPRERLINTIELGMNFPIFQGGLVASQTRQAKYQFQASSEQLEKTYRDVIANSHIAFNTVNDGISKVKADRQTILSQQSSLDSVYAQYKVGTRTMTDVVNAQRNLFEAQEQLASDQYAFINAILNLKYLAGTLNVDDLAQINAWLATTRRDGIAPRPRLH